MQRNIKTRGFVSHAVFRALFVFIFAALINSTLNLTTHALPYISISSDNNITILGDDIGSYVAPTSSGALGVGVDHVNINTDCSAGYRLYVSGTSSSSTDLVREDAEDPTSLDNRISTSSTAVGSESALAKNTWGVGKNGTDFAKIQDYSLDPGAWSPIYTGSGNNLNVYYGVNVSVGKNPGIYSGDVLYTAILNDACLKYTLEFDTSSATTVDVNAFEPRTIGFGSNVDLSEFSDTSIISRIGYNLTGWKYILGDQEYEFDIHFGADINPNDANKITLVPVWTPITYNLIYSAGETGGTCSELSVPVAYDADVMLPGVICTKTGYTQDGWSASQFSDNAKDYDLGQILEHPNFSSTDGNSYTLYPHFSINSHLLTINSDPVSVASTSPETGEVEYNTEITATCVANAGYHCAGWTSSDTSVLPDSSIVEYIFNMPDSPVTLTAVANPNTYIVRYNANGGTGTTDSQTGQAYNADITLPENGFLRPGHHFIGWAYSASAEAPDFTGGQTGVSVATLAENNATGSVVGVNGGIIDLYAIWDINNYTFVFDTNGGTGYPASASSSASYEGNIVPPGVGTMEKANAEFIGWSIERTTTDPSSHDTVTIYDANTIYNASTIVSAAGKANENDAEITLFAVWSGLPFTLRTANGNPTAIASISPDTTGTTKLYGSSVTVSCTPNSGYHCTGWTSSDTNLLDSSTLSSYEFNMPAGDITLTANGAVNTYTIRYNANGGTGTTDSQTGQAYGSTTTLRSNGFSRTGYSFRGWAYNSAASDKDFNNGEPNVSVSTLAANNSSGSVVDINGGTITLYAVWTPNTYTIAYTAGNTGGSCSVSSTSATYDSYATLSSSTCTKSGHHQDGWSTINSSSNSKNYELGGSAINLTDSGTAYLYPHFVPNTYTIRYTSYGAPQYSHTPNISDSGSQSGNYDNNMNTNEVITIPGASKLRITLTYQTESTSYDWVSFWAGNYPNYTASSNYSSGVKLGSNTDGKYGGTTKTTVEGDISGNTVTFSFHSDTSVTNYGYYAVITPLDSSGNRLSNVTGSTESQTAAYGQSVALRSNGFSNPGYSFNQWSFSQTASSGSYYEGSSYAVSSLADRAGVIDVDGGVITLWAAWQQQTTYRTLTVNAGSCISSVSGSGSKVVGNTAYISASASTGCHFDYWNVNSGGASLSSYYSASTSFTMPDNNVTVTAYGAYNTYTISYNPNGGSGTPASHIDVAYNSSVTLRNPSAPYQGYDFKGWSLSSTASSASYFANTSYSVSTLASDAGVANSNGATITLYAVWEKQKTADVAFQTAGSCADILPGTTGNLYDSRDNQVYSVYRWPIEGTTGVDYPTGMKGKCIMTEDLALGNVTSGSITKDYDLTLTSSDSYSSGTVTARTSAGSWNTDDTSSNLQYMNSDGHTYYSYYAAQKVCPKGWKPPTKTQWVSIVTQIGNATNALNSPYNFKLNGFIRSGDGVVNKGSVAQYWSSSTTTSPNANALYISSGGSFIGDDAMARNLGFTVRCYNSSSSWMHSITVNAITPGTSGVMEDYRDDQFYTVYRFPVTGNYPEGLAGKVIMTQDLSLGYVSSALITRDSNLSLDTDYSAAKATITARTGTSWSTTNSDSNRQYRNGGGESTFNEHTYYSYGAAQAVCPLGWRLPTETEFGSLTSFLGNVTNALQDPYNFVLGGFYYSSLKSFGQTGTAGLYWTSTPSSISSSSGVAMRLHLNEGLEESHYEKSNGLSVRCILNR